MADDLGFEKVPDGMAVPPPSNPARLSPKIEDELRRVINQIDEEGVAGGLGTPVDLANRALKALGLPASAKPFGGSESIREGMQALGITRPSAAPQTIWGKAVGTIGSGAAASVLGGGAMGGAVRQVGRAAASPALESTGKILASPAGNLAAGAGGAGGGAIARESTKGTALEEPATLAGEFVGGALTGFAPSTALRAPRSPDPIISAYERLKLAPSAAEAGIGGRTAQWLEGNILPQTIGGGGVMERFRQDRFRQLNQIQQNLANEYGNVRPRAESGKAIQEFIMDTWTQVKDKDGQLIGQLKEKYGPDILYSGELVNAAANPTGSGASKSVRAATLDPLVQEAQNMIRLTGGQLTFSDLAALKAKYGYAMEPGFQKNVNDAQVAQLFSAVRKDMEAHIKAKSPDDFAQLKASNTRYAEAQTDFTRYFKKLVGTKDIPVSSERAYEIMTAAATEKARGDIAEFKHVWDALPPQERGNLSATILGRLGATDKGAPGSLETWSLGKFVSGYRELAPEAKKMLFEHKPKVSRELDDLVTVADNIQDRVTRLASSSRSGTGAIILGQFGLGGIAGHLLAGDITKGLFMGVGGPYMAAQVLTNPTAVKTLAGTLRRVDAAIDASARAAVDLGTLPKAQTQSDEGFKHEAIGAKQGKDGKYYVKGKNGQAYLVEVGQ